MIKTLIIRMLFKLLKVEDNTKDLILFEDAAKLLDGDDYVELEKAVNLKYFKSLAEVANTPNFTQWLYFQIVIKQRQHILTLDKDKKVTQRASILSFLFILDRLREADDIMTPKTARGKSRKVRKKAANS